MFPGAADQQGLQSLSELFACSVVYAAADGNNQDAGLFACG